MNTLTKHKLRGLVCCGGHGTRLAPITETTNKHMVGILNKPMVLYPIETLKRLGITDIMIVAGGGHVGDFADFLGSGKKFGVNLTYRVQEEAGGIAQAIALAEDFAAGSPLAVVLGDNIFENDSIPVTFPPQVGMENAMFFFSPVKDPQRFGVPVFNRKLKKGECFLVDDSMPLDLIKIEEKPKNPQSNYAVTGLYIYPNNVFDIISTLKPSARGEMEVSDINNWYVEHNRCNFMVLKGFWKDAGTRDSLKEVTDWAYKNNK